MAGMDPIAQHMVEQAIQRTLDELMKQRPGGRRIAYVCAVVADGPHAVKVNAYSAMNNAVAHQVADAFEHESDAIRQSARAGLMATAQKAALKQRGGGGG